MKVLAMCMLLAGLACGTDDGDDWLSGFGLESARTPAWLADIPGAPVPGVPVHIHRVTHLDEVRAIIGEMSTRFRVPTNYLSSFKVFVVSCDEPATCRLASGPRQGATERVVVTLGPPADIAPGPALPVAATVLLMSVFAQSTRLELISPAGAVLGATGL